MRNFDDTQVMATRLNAGLALAAAPIVAATGLIVGTTGWLAVIGAAIATVLALGALRLPAAASRLVAAQALTAQIIVLNAALSGHPFQIDIHMAYFAALAVIATMHDLRALCVAAGTIAVHHLLLTLLLPALVYPSDLLATNIQRTLIHAAIVVVETAALSLAIHKRAVLESANESQRAEIETAANDARRALESAEREKARANELQAEAEARARETEESRDAAREALTAAQADTEARQKAEAQLDEQRQAQEAEVAHAVGLLITKLQQLAAGDLTIRFTETLPPAYVPGMDAFNEAAAKVATALQDVIAESSGIQDKARQVHGAVEDMTQNALRQSSTLKALNSALRDTDALVLQISADSAVARSQTDDARARAEQGATIMNRALSAMDQIENSSAEVRKIISVIDDIAFQTNLLALNAGVEAARAGESGRGFAVVATEVRALATRSSEAAREIDALISASVTMVAEGVGLVKRTDASLSEIRESVEIVAGAMEKITGAAEQQQAGLNTVKDHIEDLDNISTANTQFFGQTRDMNGDLSEAAQRLFQMTGKFRVSDQPGGDDWSMDVPTKEPRTRQAS